MPFEKRYGQLLQTLPSELRESSIQYHELKELIGNLVHELNDLGLSPETLREVVSTVESSGDKPISDMGLPDHLLTLAAHLDLKEQIFFPLVKTPEGKTVPQRVAYSKIFYEVLSESGKPFPQLRVCITAPTPSEATSELRSATDDTNSASEYATRSVVPSALRVVSALHPEPEEATNGRDREPTSATSVAVAVLPVESKTTIRESVIPLVHDAEFFDLLESNIQVLTAQMEKIHSGFLKSLSDLARMIANTCQPASATGNYHPYSSVSTHPGTVEVKVRRMKSDLYAWREIFGVFVESDVFEHFRDDRKVEWSIEESEEKLNAFADKVTKQKGSGCLKEKFKHEQSAEALRIFIALNFLILDIRKAFQANIDAIQKLVKKHTEHTALPISCSFSENAGVVSIGHLYQSSRNSLSELIHPRLFIQDVAEKLFPIVPSLDDYVCAICTNVAFKPIRLSCAHLFCARCLVKMQRRGEGNCPMCRAPCVLEANAKNVDWALLNFMEDWFPREAREKLKENEKEVVNEQKAEWRQMMLFVR